MFYFVEPNEENFTKYEKWVSSARQSEEFFGDMVKNCYKCSVKPGQTMFIPTGAYELKQPVNPLTPISAKTEFLLTISIQYQPEK